MANGDKSGFDLEGARKAGYTDAEIYAYLASRPAKDIHVLSSPNAPASAPFDLKTGAGAQAASQAQATGAMNARAGALPREPGLATGGTYPPGSPAEAAAKTPIIPGDVNKVPAFSFSGPTGDVPVGQEEMGKLANRTPAIAGALATFVPGEIAGQFISRLFGKATPIAEDAEQWQRANAALNVKPSAIRIGEAATGIESAATNPGRTLARLGLTADKLEAMAPIERQAAIAPELRNAGQAINAAIKDATDAGKKLDIGKSTFDVLKRIKGVDAQQQAVDALSHIQNELGIQNLRDVTPQEARDFRDALKYGARFNTGGDLSSLGGIRANLYRAASSDLEAAVPKLDKLNEAYSDLRAASQSVRNQVAKEMVTKPPPPPSSAAAKAGKAALVYGGKAALGGAGLGLGYGGVKFLSDMISPK